MAKKHIISLAAVMLLAAALILAGRSFMGAWAAPSGPGLTAAQAETPVQLSYQGRLADPATGQAKPDGAYNMTFSLYADEMGGTPLWTETKPVTVTRGVFSTALGDSAPLDHSLFNGQALWLGVKVESDPEARPRQRLTPVAYALSLAPGAVISGSRSLVALVVRNQGTAVNFFSEKGAGAYVHSADDHGLVGAAGEPGDVSPGQAGVIGIAGGHPFPFTGIAGVAGVSDVANGVEGNSLTENGVVGYSRDGSGVYGESFQGYGGYFTSTRGSGLYASSLITSGNVHGMEGHTASTTGDGVFGYASASSGAAYGVYGLTDSVNGRGVYGSAGATTGLNYGVYGRAESQDGRGVYGYSRGVGVLGASGGGLAGVYGTNQDGPAMYADGSMTVTGELETQRVIYSSPRVQYFMVGSEGFAPGGNVDYFNTYGAGGAYIVTGSGALVAPVHLPQGAVVTAFKVFFYDNSTSDMTVSLEWQGMSSGYTPMASVATSGTPGYSDGTDTAISDATIDNTLHSYLVYAYSDSWDNNTLRIKGALVTYTISEAP